MKRGGFKMFGDCRILESGSADWTVPQEKDSQERLASKYMPRDIRQFPAFVTLIRAPHASFDVLIRRLVDPDGCESLLESCLWILYSTRQAALSDRTDGADCVSKPIDARAERSSTHQLAACTECKRWPINI